MINSVLGKSKHKSDIPNTFIINGHILSGSFEIAEGFNNFFANIGPELSKKFQIHQIVLKTIFLVNYKKILFSPI